MTEPEPEKVSVEHIQTQDLFILEIGRFAISFERIVSYIRESIIDIFLHKGLNDPQFAMTILGDLNAEPIRQTFEKITPYYFKKSEQEFIKEILNQFSLLIQIRNRIIHCYWIIGVVKSEPPTQPVGIGLKRKVTSRGVKDYNLEILYEEMIGIISETKVFEVIMHKFNTNIHQKNSIKTSLSLDHIKGLRFDEILATMKLDK